jgi:hypothetical protein
VAHEVELLGGRLPAEHGHGTVYKAPSETVARWSRIDPKNLFNPGELLLILLLFLKQEIKVSARPLRVAIGKIEECSGQFCCIIVFLEMFDPFISTR